jgi:predicted component of type VI protein secretion system
MPASQTTACPTLVLSTGDTVIRRIALDRACLRIGRREDNDLMLDDLTVSGEHAVLHTRAGIAVISDLGSRNGTLVNGLGVTQRVLADGDCIRIGIYALRYVTERMEALPFESPLVAHFMTLSGPRTGETLAVDRARVSLRADAGQIAVVAARRNSHWLTHLDGTGCPLINGEPIGLATRELDDADFVEVGGTLFQYCLGLPS